MRVRAHGRECLGIGLGWDERNRMQRAAVQMQHAGAVPHIFPRNQTAAAPLKEGLHYYLPFSGGASSEEQVLRGANVLARGGRHLPSGGQCRLPEGPDGRPHGARECRP